MLNVRSQTREAAGPVNRAPRLLLASLGPLLHFSFPP